MRNEKMNFQTEVQRHQKQKKWLTYCINEHNKRIQVQARMGQDPMASQGISCFYIDYWSLYFVFRCSSIPSDEYVWDAVTAATAAVSSYASARVGRC